MIPRILHYCWFGGAGYSPLVRDCIETWADHLEDYRYIKWDESNSPLEAKYVSQAIRDKKWAFASDYVRLHALFEFGGVYLDTDMELISGFDSLLEKDELFIGYESSEHVGLGVIGANKGNLVVRELIECLEKRAHLGMPYLSIPKIFKEVFGDYPQPGGETRGVRFLKKEVFYPYNPYEDERKKLMMRDITEETVAIHHWEGSWVDDKFSEKAIRKLKDLLSGVRFQNKAVW